MQPVRMIVMMSHKDKGGVAKEYSANSLKFHHAQNFPNMLLF
jgi:hypothetical protein